MFNIIPLKTEHELLELDKKMSNFSVIERDDFMREFDNYLSDLSSEQCQSIMLGYLRWYVIWRWSALSGLARPSFPVIFSKTILIACLLEFNALSEYLWYLGLRAIDEEDMKSLHSKTVNFIVGSEYIVGTWQGKSVTMAEVVQQMRLIISHNYDSIKLAEFETRLKQIIFPRNNENQIFYQYFGTNQDVVIKNFVSLIDFFLSIEVSDIKEVVEDFLFSEAGIEKESIGLFANSVSKRHAASNIDSLIDTSKVPDIKNQINSQFRQSPDGNYEDIDGVFAKLDELATKYNDPKIAEMLYWDEAKGQFVWQE